MTGQATSGRPRWSLVLASREVWPFVEGGGIGRYMWSAARALAPHADVSILTSASFREAFDELAAAGDERLPEGVRFAFAEEPQGDLSPFFSWNQLWSVRLLEAAAQLYPDGGPDVLEVADYQAEGLAAAHARRGLDPRLRNTTLAVGLHTSAEMCAAFDEQPVDVHLQVMAGLERFALRFADAVLWPGGNSLERYAEFYGEEALAPAIRRPLPVSSDGVPDSAPPPTTAPEDGPLRLLFLNRLQRLKGIAELVTAVRSLPDADLRLTVVGRDTMTGPDGGSMRAHVEELAAGDPRIDIRDAVPHAEVPALIAAHHVVAVPSRWEAFSYVVREALACNRPALATPVGGIVDVVRQGESGWLARSSSPEDLAEALGELLTGPERIAAMIAEGRPRAALEGSTTVDGGLDAYLELLERSRGAASAAVSGGAQWPSVGALVACEAGGGDPLPTLVSLEDQRDVAVRSVLVVGPSGSFPGPGEALARAHAVVATPGTRWGRPVGWEAGLAHVSGDLVLLLPAGAVLAPDFLRRAMAVLAADPRLAWVSSFAGSGTTPADASPGNYELPVAEIEASPSVGLFRRRALEDVLRDTDPDAEQELFARLTEAGSHGVVLQEELVAAAPRRAARPVPAQR
jgi:glycogen synthase